MAIWDRFFGTAVSTAAGYGMGSSLAPALAPVTQQVANETWALFPLRPLPATIAANLVAQGKMEQASGADEALKQGFDNGQFDRMVRAQRTAPELVLLMELWRRGFVDESDVTSALERHGLEARWLEPLRKLRTVRPSVTDMVRFGVREVYTPEIAEAFGQFEDLPPAFVQDAAEVGVSPEDARRYWGAHWDLPSFTQGAEMYHRRIIDQGTFQKLLRALDVMPFWREKLIQLAQRIPPISDLIRFSVREVYQDATAAKYGYDDDYPADFTADAALHGMDAERARQYWRAHWRLPSAAQGYRMLHREEIDAGELDDLLRVQDYPSFWRKRLANVAYLVPGRVDLRRLFMADKLTRAQTKRGYQRLGYEPADAELLTQLAEALKAEAATEGIGSHVNKARTQLWTTTHRTYLNGDVSATVAKNNLGRVGVPVADRDAIVTLWDAERELQRKQLTPAQVKKAWQKVTTNPATGQPWSREDAIMELVARGYTVNDANTFLDLPSA